MKISKNQLTVLLGTILLLAISNIAVALYFMSRDVDITGGVDTYGAIEVYDSDGVTEMTAYDFPNFTGGDSETQFKTFFINNTGNQPVYVYWNISDSSLEWTTTEFGYIHVVGLETKYEFNIQTSWPSSIEYWSPNEYTTPEALVIPVDGGVELRIFHQYYGSPKTAETYSLTMSFYAFDT